LINPTDPVSLGLCSQIDLDNIVNIAAEKKAKRDAAAGINNDGDSLMKLSLTNNPIHKRLIRLKVCLNLKQRIKPNLAL